MAGNYAWRDCAGRTSDAIQFATQMGFVERKDGNWYLSLGEMLRFFGGSDKPECHVRDGKTYINDQMWGGDYILSIIASPNELKSKIGYPPLNVSMTMAPNMSYGKCKPYGYDMVADERGVRFNCLELCGAICAGQLMQLLAVLGRTMDEHIEWTYFMETM